MAYLFLYENESAIAGLAQHLDGWSFSPHPKPGDWQIVLRWGNTEGKDPDTVVLNTRKAIETARNPVLFHRIMSISSTPCPPQELMPAGEPPWKTPVPGLSRRYKIGVFDFSVIFVQDDWSRAGGEGGGIGGGSGGGGSLRTGELKQLKELAMRAVYTLGLDFGVVHAGLMQRTRQPVIIGVDPAPPLTSSTALRFAGAVRRYVNYTNRFYSGKRSMPVAIGADPEFVLAKSDGTGHILGVYASDYLPLAGPVGCELQPVHSNGHSYRPLAELRPKYATTPVRLFHNLRATIMQADQMIPKDILWLAGSMPDGTFPIGGHIHFSRVPFTSRLLRALDNYLTIPLSLLEEPSRALIRRSRYGYLGDARIKPHGGFEYRTPFSWLSRPMLARGVLCLAYVVAREHASLKADYFSELSYLEAFYSAEKGPFRLVFPKIWEELRRTPSYEVYSRSLGLLHDMIASGWMVDEHADFRREWRKKEGA
ncbi:MAG TPA: hypothetical protein GXX29_04265 [Firmicutes bacterium]|nr:hypothetical protein [Bacillota bacterium]